MTPLRKRMIEDMKIRNLSENTQKRYVYYVAKFAEYHGKSPDLLGPEEVRKYQVHLIEEKHLSASTLNVTVCALRFFYQVTLGRREMIEKLPYAKTEKRLPVVLSPEEVARFFQSIKSLKYFALFLIPYAAGLRISETCPFESHRHRQPKNDRSSRARERPEGSKRHAFPKASGGLERILEDLPTLPLAFPGKG